ncbi:MAG: O-antigen ligase family protein [Planctomycetaceae bacterium]|nr:O-antigen ligase family protein [Planctomycetaceae bacterium]
MTQQFITGFLIALTVFFSCEQNEITGAAHIPCLLILLASLAFLVAPLLKKQQPVLRKCCFTDYAFYTFFALTAVVSVAWNFLAESGYSAAPRPAFNQQSVWFAACALWFLLRQTLCSEKIITAAFQTLLAVFFSLALLGVYQYTVDIPQMKREFNAAPAATVRKIDPSIEPGTTSFERLADRIRTAVPMGTYPLSNTFGGILAVGVIAAVGFLVPRRRTTFLLLSFILLFVFFMIIKCRSAYIAALFGIICIVFPMLIKRWNISPVKAVVLSICIFLLPLPSLLFFQSQGKDIIAGAKQSLGFRLEYWTASMGIIQDYPVFGCGSGNFKQTYTKYKLPQSCEEISDPHNFAVEIAAVAGIPALLAFLAAVGSVLYLSQVRKNKEDTGNDSSGSCYKHCYYGGLAGCWAAFLISFLTEVPMDITAPLAATLAFPLTALLTERFCKSNEVIPSSLFAVLVLVLLIHLSAAGGISVVNTLFMLLFFCAVIVNRAKNEPLESKDVLSITYGAIVILCIAAVFVYCLGFRPVLTAFSYLEQAASEFDINRRIELLEKAAEADKFSAALQEQLVQNYYSLWLRNPLLPLEEKMFEHQEKTFRLMQRSAMLRFSAAERMNIAYHQTTDAEKRKQFLDKALRWYSEAVERYPNYASLRAPFALLLWEADRKDEALQQRDKALQIDDIMPDKEQKLKPEQRAALELLAN